MWGLTCIDRNTHLGLPGTWFIFKQLAFLQTMVFHIRQICIDVTQMYFTHTKIINVAQMYFRNAKHPGCLPGIFWSESFDGPFAFKESTLILCPVLYHWIGVDWFLLYSKTMLNGFNGIFLLFKSSVSSNLHSKLISRFGLNAHKLHLLL